MREGFVLIEFIIAIVVLGTIIIAGSKLLLSIQKQSFIQTQKVQDNLSLENTLDILKNYLLESSDVEFKTNKVLWKDSLSKNHSLEKNEDKLFLDGNLLIDKVVNFELKRNKENFEAFLCVDKIFKTCTKKFVYKWSL